MLARTWIGGAYWHYFSPMWAPASQWVENLTWNGNFNFNFRVQGIALDLSLWYWYDTEMFARRIWYQSRRKRPECRASIHGSLYDSIPIYRRGSVIAQASSGSLLLHPGTSTHSKCTSFYLEYSRINFPVIDPDCGPCAFHLCSVWQVYPRP